jgi:hypothetical protein
MAEIDICLVKYDDFTGLDSGAHFPRPFGVVVPGGVHDGKAGQKTLQVQPQGIANIIETDAVGELREE